jgi:hypothetical protein
MQKRRYKLEVLPWKKMRYLTTGDYYKTKREWKIVAADTGNSDYNFLILIHELIELYLTQKRGIAEPKIKKFDEWFERQKTKGRFKNILSPGRHPKAPYKREHMFAAKIEDLIRKELGVSKKKQWAAEDAVFEKIEKFFIRKRTSEKRLDAKS